MKKMRKLAVLLLLFSCLLILAPERTTLGQPTPAPSTSLEDQTGHKDTSSKKEKFELCLAMLKGYYDALDSRIEKSVGLLLVVVGWLITSETARKSLASEAFLFWGAVGTLTLLLIFLSSNMYHFHNRFMEIRQYIIDLNYMEPKYFTRWKQMPKGILFVYLAPVLIFYIFLVLLLFQIRYNFLSVKPTKSDTDV